MAEGYSFLIHVDDNLGEGGSKEEESHERPGAHEREEVAIIPTANAIVEPNAVVIVSLDAVVTDSTVMSPGRSPNITCPAIFHWHLHRRI